MKAPQPRTIFNHIVVHPSSPRPCDGSECIPGIQGLFTMSVRWVEDGELLVASRFNKCQHDIQPTMDHCRDVVGTHMTLSSCARIHLFWWIRHHNPPSTQSRSLCFSLLSTVLVSGILPLNRFILLFAFFESPTNGGRFQSTMTIIIERILKLIIIITVIYRGYAQGSPDPSMHWTRDTFILIDD